MLKEWIQVLRSASDDTLIEELATIVPDYPYFKKLQKVMRQKCPENQRIRRRFVFFDCFQTMRWVHHLRDNHWPSIPIEEALRGASFIDLQCPIEKPSISNLAQWSEAQSAMYQHEKQCRAITFQL